MLNYLRPIVTQKPGLPFLRRGNEGEASYIYSGKSNFSFVNSLIEKCNYMKAVRTLFICVSLVLALSSCKLWGNIFKPKYGCKTDGRNVGAEKLATGDPAAEKAAKKAKKFKS